MAADGTKEEEFLYLLTEGSDLLRAGSVANARDYFERALLLEPGNEQALNLLGLALHRLEHFKEAEGIFRDLIHNNPVEPSLRLNLAMVLLKRSDLEGARRELEVVIDLNPDHPRAASYMGLVHERREAFASAALWYERAGNQKRAMQMRVRAEAALAGEVQQKAGADPSFLDGPAVLEDETSRSTPKADTFDEMAKTQSEGGNGLDDDDGLAIALPGGDAIAPAPPSAEEIGLKIESTDEHLSMPPVDIDIVIDDDNAEDEANEISSAAMMALPVDDALGHDEDDDFASPTQEFTAEAIRVASIAASAHKEARTGESPVVQSEAQLAIARAASEARDLEHTPPPPDGSDAALDANAPDLNAVVVDTGDNSDASNLSLDDIEREIDNAGAESASAPSSDVESGGERLLNGDGTNAFTEPTPDAAVVDDDEDSRADAAIASALADASLSDDRALDGGSVDASASDAQREVRESEAGNAVDNDGDAQISSGAEAAALAAARADAMRKPNAVPDEGVAQQARSASLGFTLDVETGRKAAPKAQSETAGANARGGRSVQAFADDNDAYDGVMTLHRRDDGAMIVPIDEVAYLRTDLLVSLCGQFEIEPLNRRYRGRRTDSLFGGNQTPMVAVMGSGTAVFDPGPLDVCILELVNEELYLVECALASFSAGLVWENGRLPSEGGPDLDIVHLRGSGAVVLGNKKRVYAHAVLADAPVTLHVDRLVGWNGQVVPYRGELPGLPETAQKPAIVRFEGNGLVFGT